MGKFLEQSKYIVLLGVVSLLAATFATFVWGVLKTVSFIATLVSTGGRDSLAILNLLDLTDTFLIGTVLFIFSLGLYELFVGELNLPEWLIVDNLSKLKGKLSDVIVLFMAIKFLEKLLTKEPQDALWFALAVAVVSAALIAFNRFRAEKG